MVKKRVHELAKELNIESKDIIKLMSQVGINIKSHMSTLEDKDIELLLKHYPQKNGQAAETKAKEKSKPPAADKAGDPPATTENQAGKPLDKPRNKTVPEDTKRQERKDYRYDRGPGLVDRVPSRPPDRRFDDRPSRFAPPRKNIPPQPAAFQRPETSRQEPLPGQKVPPPKATVQPSAARPDIEQTDQKPAAKAPQNIEKPRYPDRTRPSMQMDQDQRRDSYRQPQSRDYQSGESKNVVDKDRRTDHKAADSRGYQRPHSGGDRGRFNRSRPESDRPGTPNRPGEARPAGLPSTGRPGVQGGRPDRGRPGANWIAQNYGNKPKPEGLLKVPKVPEQAKGVDKIKASEKSRARMQQNQARGFSKSRDKNRLEEDRVNRIVQPRKKPSATKGKQEAKTPIVQEKKPIIVGESITVQELAEKMKKSPAELIKRLFQQGIMATINQEIDSDTAVILANDMGFEAEVKIELDAEAQMELETEDNPADLVTRPCVVTVMGHVDHGKTSLLDAIRETNVIATEAGGITQHIGAYQVTHNNKKITFVDTPGHEAFTAMRARGAQVTDIAVLVVAAEDGVMPQTIEAINHAKAAGVPIIVAINKMDKPGANPERIKQQLTEHDLLAEEWGGDIICVPVSAKARQGIDDLLENILLVAEVSEFKANPKRSARGTVIEAQLDKGRGPLATVLVQNGTLYIGDGIVAGTAFGRVRAMMDYKGRRIKKAGPSVPVEVLGFHEVPEAGDTFYVVKDEKSIKQIIDKRTVRKRQEDLKNQTSRVSLEDLFKQIKEGQVKELNLIVKADVQGSVEAVKQSLERLSTDEVKVNIIHGGVGAIRESDIMLASTSNAIIIGFNVRPDVNARKAAESESVDIRLYRVIYEAIDDIKAAMSGLLEPELKEVALGRVEVRKLFKASKLGNIAGCYVTEGKVARDASVRLIRDDIVIYEGKIDSLKRFKDDVKEVMQGYECGLTLENYQDVHEGDVIEVYTTEQVKRELV